MGDKTKAGSNRRALKHEWEQVDWSESNQSIAIRMGVTDFAVHYQRKRRAPDSRPSRAVTPSIRRLFRSALDGEWYLTMGAAGEFDAVWSMGSHLVRVECGVCGTKEQWNGEGWACPHGHVKVSDFDRQADALIETIRAKVAGEKRPEFLRVLSDMANRVEVARQIFHHYNRTGVVKLPP